MKPSVKKSLGVVVIVALIVTVIIVSIRSRPLEVISVERAVCMANYHS